ncbi:MAG: nucleoside deaminase [Clostridia bacterium]|nr:nucleoside deaminase [Clostridia bacterium]
MKHEEYMKMALECALQAADEGEIPVGAVIVCDDRVIAKASNTKEADGCSISHAEINVIKQTGRKYLEDCTLYVTLEPCPMCAGAIINSRVGRVVFGAYDEKGGACGSVCNLFEMPFNHRPYVTGGVCEQECVNILRSFFEEKRK